MGWASGKGGPCNLPLVVCYLPMSENEGGSGERERGEEGRRERLKGEIETRERDHNMQSNITTHSIQENWGAYHMDYI